MNNGYREQKKNVVEIHGPWSSSNGIHDHQYVSKKIETHLEARSSMTYIHGHDDHWYIYIYIGLFGSRGSSLT